MLPEGGALTTTWYLDLPIILEAAPPSSTSNLWFIEKECVLNEGATIVTKTELRSTTPETVNTTTNCLPYRILLFVTGKIIFGRNPEEFESK
ncbi:hypothetical protein HanXRQr2_Chr09g0407201 [Helianthus annuus]|uniref:Uncharacterized protein n=1 Tax=Helianthus annuus TaxID=4232 RepID=A0A9K3NAK6_HELAN|nr:hypothetical protein HanXRQr2_Chr09g0407201 [Helianthus annuus]